MWPLNQPKENAEAVNSVLTLKRSRLNAVETLYKEAEEKFQEAILKFVRHRNNNRQNAAFVLGDKVFLRVHPTPDPELDRLAHERWIAEFRRNELLAERWELRKSLGLSR
jgi:hypothetical protein